MIPNNIIQNYESSIDDLPIQALGNIIEWKNLNPNWNHLYFDKDQRAEFVKNNFGDSWFKIYQNLPLNIMKANVFKYMSLYILGGLYSDLDRFPNKSIESWLDLNKSFVLCGDSSEPDFIFSIQILTAEPKHFILESVLNVVENNIKNIKEKNIDRFSVLQLTGEVAFTKGIKKAIDPLSICKKNDGAKVYNSLTLAKEKGFYCFEDDYIFTNDVAIDLDGAFNWKNGYKNWWEEADEFKNSKGNLANI